MHLVAESLSLSQADACLHNNHRVAPPLTRSRVPCRTWCLTLTYGFCFGIELTINNIIAAYLFDQFGVSLTIAGLIGSLFGAPPHDALSLNCVADRHRESYCHTCCTIADLFGSLFIALPCD